MRRYHIQNREDYHKFVCFSFILSPLILNPNRYNKLCGQIRSYAYKLTTFPPDSPFRHKMEAALLNKLYDMGILNSTTKLSDVEGKLTVSAFCRRRLGVVMCAQLKMAETVSAVSIHFSFFRRKVLFMNDFILLGC